MAVLDVSRYCSERALDEAAFRAQIEQFPHLWFHAFAFSNGVTIAGRDPSEVKLHALRLPERLDGLSVLDIGAVEGYFAFQAEARGAARVLATDYMLWDGVPALKSREKFHFVRDATSSRVEDAVARVEDLSPAAVGTFDVTLFLGVLYHAPDMMMYLNRVRSVTHGYAVIETFVDLLDVEEPAAAFYPPGVLNGDDSNWWGPNLACVEQMLLRAGFRTTQFIGLWEVNSRKITEGRSHSGGLRSGRAVWHAYV